MTNVSMKSCVTFGKEAAASNNEHGIDAFAGKRKM
jgi:hypothetical protein